MPKLLPLLALAILAAPPAAAATPGKTRACAVTAFANYKRAQAAQPDAPATRDLAAATEKLLVMAATEEGIGMDDGRYKQAIEAEADTLVTKPRTGRSATRAKAELQACFKRAGLK